VTFVLKDIADHLTGSADIADAVSNRVYPDYIPQEARDSLGQKQPLYPCLVLGVVSGEPEYVLSGEGGVHQTIIQLDVWTDGDRGSFRANEIAEMVRNRLSGYRGTFGTGCRGTARMIRSNPIAVAPVDASDTYRRRVSMDFELIHTADAPDFT